MSLRYVKEVLGVDQIIRPKSFPYSVYGSLDKKLMLLSEEDLFEEHSQLIERMMASLNQKSFFTVCLKKNSSSVNVSSHLKNLLYRSSAELLIAFGDKSREVLKEAFPEVFSDAFHQVVCFDLPQSASVRAVATYSLSDFCSSSKSSLEIRKIKLEAFSALKKL